MISRFRKSPSPLLDYKLVRAILLHVHVACKPYKFNTAFQHSNILISQACKHHSLAKGQQSNLASFTALQKNNSPILQTSQPCNIPILQLVASLQTYSLTSYQYSKLANLKDLQYSNIPILQALQNLTALWQDNNPILQT